MTLSLKQLGFGVAVVAAGFASGAAWSQSQDKEKVVAERQELMKQQGRELVAVRNFFQGKGDQAAASAGIESLRSRCRPWSTISRRGPGPAR